MTTIELRQKLIDQINQLSPQKLLFLEKLIQSLESFFPEARASRLGDSDVDIPVETIATDGLWSKITSPEDDPIIGMCSGKIPNLAERAEEILETRVDG